MGFTDGIVKLKMQVGNSVFLKVVTEVFYNNFLRVEYAKYCETCFCA